MFKYTIPHLLRWIFPNYTWKVKTTKKVVYFTFDDGPHPEITLWVLEQLAVYNAKATFFMVGENIVKHPEIFEQVKQKGHQIGNHTFNHLKGWKTNNDVYFQNMERCQQLTNTHLFRPPYGRIKKSQAEQILQTHQIIMWNRLSRDYEANLNISESLKAMQLLPANGHIFVFHDSEKAFKNLQIILPQLLEFYKNEGYDFERLC
ncbi:MAG: polysaccharide deacetylase family protein [Bacteroidia bacterium]|nr:polysaccharide deacetylase family protein [Bacteroidia bacterium]